MSEGKNVFNQTLQNGLKATVTDVSQHYYGGYWKVAIEVVCNVPVQESFFTDSATAADARKIMGNEVSFVRHLEQMAVHQDDLESSKQKLLDRFEHTIMPFLANNLFAPRFIQTEYQQRRKKQTRGIPSQL